MWADFREAGGPGGAHHGARRQELPLRGAAQARAAGSLALPDAGSFKDTQGKTISHSSSAQSSTGGLASGLSGLFAFPGGMSNALVVSAAHSSSGHPLAVFGPQTAYFAPEILMEEDVHGPGHRRRAAPPSRASTCTCELGRGARLRVERHLGRAGHHRHLRAAALRRRAGGSPRSTRRTTSTRAPAADGDARRARTAGRPTLADSTPRRAARRSTAERTALGMVTGRAHRATASRCVYASLRTTYFHEVDSARGFKDMNDPAKVNERARLPAARCRRSATRSTGSTWTTSTSRYFNSGANPVRATRRRPELPGLGRARRSSGRASNPTS